MTDDYPPSHPIPWLHASRQSSQSVSSDSLDSAGRLSAKRSDLDSNTTSVFPGVENLGLVLVWGLGDHQTGVRRGPLVRSNSLDSTGRLVAKWSDLVSDTTNVFPRVENLGLGLGVIRGEGRGP